MTLWQNNCIVIISKKYLVRFGMKVNVLGSCVSRISLLKGERDGHGIYGDKADFGYFLDKQNIALAMMPPPDFAEEALSIKVEELHDKSRLKSLCQNIMKSTVDLLLTSDADYLVMDLYDFDNSFIIYGNTAFGTQAGEFLGTELFKRYSSDMTLGCFFEMPGWVYYPYVDLFFEKISKKYDADHIILNRFRANTYFLHTNGEIGLVPEGSKMLFQCKDKYNERRKQLEEYIIKKYNPYVIDISKFFMGDANLWPDNLNGAHFEKEFYRETYDQIMRIIYGETDIRYYDKVKFFNTNREGWEEDKQRAFNVENGIAVFNMFVEKEEYLWLNMLDKLYMYAPENEQVQQYIQLVKEKNIMVI